jgi:hypothetical protein
VTVAGIINATDEIITNAAKYSLGNDSLILIFIRHSIIQILIINLGTISFLSAIENSLDIFRGLRRCPLDAFHLLPDLAGGGGLPGQFLDFVGHDREPFAGFLGNFVDP